MKTPGERLRAFVEARWLALGRRRHGMQIALQAETGIKRQTMGKWFGQSAEPDLRSLGPLAEALLVTRAELVAAFDGVPLPSAQALEARLLTDGVRRRRRKWWLAVARQTAHLGLDEAREQLAARGFRSEKGNLVTLWENPANALEPSEAELRALAEIYRLPTHQLVELSNNPPETDEERMAARRTVRIEEVATEIPEVRRRRRRTA